MIGNALVNEIDGAAANDEIDGVECKLIVCLMSVTTAEISMAKLLVFLFAAGIVACTAPQSDDSDPPDSSTPVKNLSGKLVGTWVYHQDSVPCHETWGSWNIIRITFSSESEVVFEDVAYNDAACEEPLAVSTLRRTTDFLGESSLGNGIEKIDFTLIRYELAPLADWVRDDYNNASQFGFDDWETNEAKDCTNLRGRPWLDPFAVAGEIVKGLIQLAHDEESLLLEKGFNDGERPVDFDSPWLHIRQR